MATFSSKARNDEFTGKERTFDTYYSNAINSVTINLTTGLAEGGTEVGIDKIINIEAAHGGKAADSITGNAKANDLFGYGGNDEIFGLDGNDDLYGGDGDDTLDGGRHDDDLFGGNGNDELFGREGNDDLYGDAGIDTLDGGSGCDFLIGGAGNDILTGGTEADLFIFGVGSGQDTIQDFNISEGDKIDLDYKLKLQDDVAVDGDGDGFVDDTKLIFNYGVSVIVLNETTDTPWNDHFI